MPERALQAWEGFAQATVTPIAQGLINDSYLVARSGEQFVLQKLNAIFDPLIHHNIDAVCEHVHRAGITTPRLLRTSSGELWAEGAWRLMTFVDGTGHDYIQRPAQAHAASRLVARWHTALDDLDHEFVGMRLGVHDTDKHIATLHDAVVNHRQHRLSPQVAPLADELLAAIVALPALPQLPPQISHGDLKISNVLFDRDEAIALIDLDTVGPMALAHELGDAWRSWCNPNKEDVDEVRFDLDVFEASWTGYAAERTLQTEDRTGLLHGVEHISLELAIRFAADALREDYFGWDSERYPAAGEHNLARARGQLALHSATLQTRVDRARILGL